MGYPSCAVLGMPASRLSVCLGTSNSMWSGTPNQSRFPQLVSLGCVSYSQFRPYTALLTDAVPIKVRLVIGVMVVAAKVGDAGGAPTPLSAVLHASEDLGTWVPG